MSLSAFAGTYNAIEFGYGNAGCAAGVLTVLYGSTSTGTYTITCSPNDLVTADGRAIPINTSTPITVGSDSNIETVTPTSVSVNQLSQVQITATFTYAHGTGDSVRSGSRGLGEAASYAGSNGGGIVAIDAKWVAAGGTQALVESTTFPAGVTLDDNRGGAVVGTFTYTLTNAQILTLNTVPVELLPNPDASSMYLVTEAVIVNLNTGTAYASGGAITIGWGTTTATTEALSGTIAATFLTDPTATAIAALAGAQITAPTSTNSSTYLGKGIWMAAATANFTTGTGTLQVTLSYIKILT